MILESILKLVGVINYLICWLVGVYKKTWEWTCRFDLPLGGTGRCAKMSKVTIIISFNDSAKNIFKTMSLSDDSMWEYFKLLLNYQETKINEMKEIHPMDAKKTLAESLTSLFYEEKVAKKEREEFSKVFSKGKVPEVMPTYSLSVLNLEKNNLLNVLSSTVHFDSKGEIRRLINQGAVDNERIDDGEIVFQICLKNEAIVKVGKDFH